MAGGQAEKIAGQLMKIVLDRLEAGRLVVPSPPNVVTKCMQVLKAPDYQAKKLVSHIETDPLLAALVLREASSAAHGSGVKSIDAAISRLGADKLKSIVMKYAANEMFESYDSRIKAANKKIWEHSVACALVARDLAAFAGSQEGEACYLGGLLHDVGKPVFAAMMLEAERKLGNVKSGWIDSTAWANAVTTAHRQVGTALAQQWALPAEVASAIRDCSDYDSNERNCSANIVRLANAIAKREGYVTEAVAMDDVDAMIMVGRSMLGIDEDVIARLSTNLKQRVAQAVE